MILRTLTLLLLIALTGRIFADEPPPITAEQLRQAVSRSLPLLEKGAIGHRENRSCFSCHQQGVPLLTLATAKSRGFDVNEAELARQAEFIADFLNRNRQAFLDGKGTGGQVDTAGYALLALEQLNYPADENTEAVAEYLLKFQKDADHWTNSSNRPPTEASAFTTNYVGLRGLLKFGGELQQERMAERRRQVREWLGKATANDTEDHVFRLLALKLLDEPSETIAQAADALKQLQREDGSWSQTPEMEPDAYATGTALFALQQSGQLPAAAPAYQAALRYLLKTQLDDGSWHVASRSKPFQKYFETGFPHGKDQFISSAATAWATTAMLLAIEPPK